MRRIAPLGAALLCMTLPAAADESLIDVGQPFPLVRLPLAGEDGAFDSLESYRGRKVMLHLFASW